MLVCPQELSGQQFHLLLQILYLFSFRVIIPYWHVGYLSCFACVLEGAQVFLQVFVTRMQAGQHAAERIATQGLPEEASQL